jgi:formate dehydrogenase subunit gamma
MATLNIENACRKDWRSRNVFWLVLLALIATLALASMATPAYAEENENSSPAMEHGNPIANYWRTVRGGEAGITTESGPYTTDTLIQNGGQNWRQIRNGLIANYGGWVLGIALAGIALFFAVRGRIRLEEGYSGKRIMRFSLWQRIVHWYTATTVIVLALSGLIILFGRALLIPLFGKDAFSVLAEGSKIVHNFVGPLFLVAVLMLILTFLAGNLFRKGDLKWLTSGGGMRKGKHASAGRYNAGEKLWFWLASIAGILIAATGVVLDFPGFGQTREVMQLAEIVHASFAILLIAVAFGHIYIGTLGTEGAIDAMSKGHVDANWARQHHDRWYEEMEKSGMVKSAADMEESTKDTGAQPGVAHE